jgi:hypothetical protein
MSESRPVEGEKTGRSHIDAIAAATAIVVSFASLYVAWRQTSLMQRQLEASVWPSLSYETDNSLEDGKAEITFSLQNSGVGPARVRSLEVSFRGAPLTGGLALLHACCVAPGEQAKARPSITFAVGRVIPAGQKIAFLTVPQLGDDDPLWRKLNDARFEIDGRVCYCSALDQCWTVGFHDPEPTSTPSCADAQARPQYAK